MNLDRYTLNAEDGYAMFRFNSVGAKGRIIKIIQYRPIGHEGDLFNLGFGDLNEATGEVNDVAISDNGDTTKVLATVIYSLYLFTSQFPDAKVVVSGSTESRNRLYRIGIAKHYEEAIRTFDLYGFVDDLYWEKYKPDTNYTRFLVIRKS